METAIQPRRRRRWWPRLIAVAAAILAFLGGGLLLRLNWTQSRHRAREAHTRAMMHAVESALEQYRRDFGMLPPGDGTGSKELVDALTRPGPRGMPYLEVRPSDLTPEGHLRNFLWDDPPRNRIFYGPGGRLWAAGCEGHVDVIKNRGR